MRTSLPKWLQRDPVWSRETIAIIKPGFDIHVEAFIGMNDDLGLYNAELRFANDVKDGAEPWVRGLSLYEHQIPFVIEALARAQQAIEAHRHKGR